MSKAHYWLYPNSHSLLTGRWSESLRNYSQAGGLSKQNKPKMGQLKENDTAK